MAHEIRNPLTAITTFVEYLPQKYDDPKFREDFQRILKGEVARIRGIVQELMDFSKPKPPNKEWINLDKIIQDIVELLSKDLMSAKVTVKFEPAEAGEKVFADPAQIKQVFLNIFINAIEAMKEHGGELGIDVSREGEWIRAAVTDSGCGIEKERIPRIFDPFYTKKDSGTGLGLAITHSIIEQHKGRIQVESKVGKGTMFTIFLPASVGHAH